MQKSFTLSESGFDKRYTIDEAGTITDTKKGVICKANNHSFVLLDNQGHKKKVSLKTIYRAVFDTEYSVDEIELFVDEEWKPL